jgi:hypothetical protein
MITFILTLGVLFIMLEAISNAVMDTVDHHQGQSIFPKTLWWNSNQGWRNKYIDRDSTKGRVQWKWVSWITFGKFSMNKPVQLTDSWHFFKMWGITFYILSSVTLPSLGFIFEVCTLEWYEFIIYALTWVSVLGTIRNITFSFCYKKLFIK